MDLNNDGNLDILSGSYSHDDSPMAGLLQVLWGQAGRAFAPAAPLRGTDDKPLIIPPSEAEEHGDMESICTRPMAVDWDHDGDLDLVVGNFRGSFYLFRGEGDGRFLPQPEPIMAGSKPLHIDGAHSDPFPVDWDGDGDLDLVSGSSSGGVQWARNAAPPGEPPAFQGFEQLIAPPTGPLQECVAKNGLLSEEEVNQPSMQTRVWVDDVNQDGRLDLLVGDRITLSAPAAGLSLADYKARRKQWDDAWDDLAKERAEAGNNSARQTGVSVKIQNLYREWEEFEFSQDTGFVWLYLGQ